MSASILSRLANPGHLRCVIACMDPPSEPDDAQREEKLTQLHV